MKVSPHIDVFGRSMAENARVVYIPPCAHGDLNHSAVQYGSVVEWTHCLVFVRFDGEEHKSAVPPGLLTVQIQSTEDPAHASKLRITV